MKYNKQIAINWCTFMSAELRSMLKQIDCFDDIDKAILGNAIDTIETKLEELENVFH